jgi:hypothetical protein
MIVLILAVLLALATRTADAQAQYRFRTVDVPCPGCISTMVRGFTPQETILGTYDDAAGGRQGFLWTRQKQFTPLLRVVPQAINLAGAIAGSFSDGNQSWGFVFEAGTLHRINVHGVPEADLALSTDIHALNDLGQVAGTFRSPTDHRQRGFLYDPAITVFTVIAPPDAISTTLLALDNHGRVLGYRRDGHGNRRDFLWAQGTFTWLDLPGRPDAEFTGLADDGLLAGDVGPGGFFVVDGTAVRLATVPGAQVARVTGIRTDGTVYGWYYDVVGVVHGFIATPTGPPRGTQPRE